MSGRSLGSYSLDRRPLRIPAYRRLWIANVVTAVGGSFSVIAVPTQLFTLTGSSAIIGAAAAVSFVALTVACLGIGALADTVDRRHLLLAAHVGQAVTYLLLWLQAVGQVRSVPVLLVLVGCQGLSFGAIMTTMGAAVPRVVPAELLPAAISLRSLVGYTGAIVGPLLAGVLIGWTDVGSLYLFDAIALLAVLWAVFTLPSIPTRARTGVRVDRRSAPAPAGWTRSLVGQVIEGFGYLGANRLVLAVLGVDLAAMVFGMPIALFPELAQRTFGGPAGGGPTLGLLYAAYPAGVFLMGLLSGTFTRAARHGALMASAAIGWGLSVVLLGLAPALWAALIALVLGGAVNFLLSTFRNAITQAHTDDALRGRVQGSLTIVLVGGPQVANVVHAVTGPVLGARATICLGGLLTVATVCAIIVRIPTLWRYRPTPTAAKGSVD